MGPQNDNSSPPPREAWFPRVMGLIWREVDGQGHKNWWSSTEVETARVGFKERETRCDNPAGKSSEGNFYFKFVPPPHPFSQQAMSGAGRHSVFARRTRLSMGMWKDAIALPTRVERGKGEVARMAHLLQGWNALSESGTRPGTTLVASSTTASGDFLFAGFVVSVFVLSLSACCSFRLAFRFAVAVVVVIIIIILWLDRRWRC